eukprot:816752-Rhodomonas_salina.1
MGIRSAADEVVIPQVVAEAPDAVGERSGRPWDSNGTGHGGDEVGDPREVSERRPGSWLLGQHADVESGETHVADGLLHVRAQPFCLLKGCQRFAVLRGKRVGHSKVVVRLRKLRVDANDRQKRSDSLLLVVCAKLQHTQMEIGELVAGIDVDGVPQKANGTLKALLFRCERRRLRLRLYLHIHTTG